MMFSDSRKLSIKLRENTKKTTGLREKFVSKFIESVKIDIVDYITEHSKSNTVDHLKIKLTSLYGLKGIKQYFEEYKTKNVSTLKESLSDEERKRLIVTIKQYLESEGLTVRAVVSLGSLDIEWKEEEVVEDEETEKTTEVEEK